MESIAYHRPDTRCPARLAAGCVRGDGLRAVTHRATWAARLCQSLAFLFAATPAVMAQDIQVARQRGPYYVGEPVVVQIVASGLPAGDQPSCRLLGEPPDGITVQGPQVSQSSQSFPQIINGRMTRSESVDYRFSFVITAQREGDYTIGPFEFASQGTTKQIDGTSFQFGKLENDPDMQIAFSLPRPAVYVGQEIPLTIHWSFRGEMAIIQYAFSNLQIRSPLFDQLPFREQRSQSRTPLTIVTAKGGVEIDAEAQLTPEESAGRRSVEVTGTLTMIPDAPGKYADVPITCRTERVTQWGQDLFGGLRARATSPALAAGTPLSFEVKPIPLEGRPPSFSGAVGNAFSIDVSANRSVVRVGDPIALTLSVRGDGNLNNVSLPALAENEGLSADLFQTPTEQMAGTFDGTAKQFKVNIRVKNPTVTQIPPMAFSWFDPVKEQFQTTQSKPIALQVMEAQVVSAADVVAATPAQDPASRPAGTPSASGDPAGDAVAGSAFVGANLAIEQDVARLLTETALGTSPNSIAMALYALAAAAVVGGLVVRLRAQTDTVGVQRKKRLKALRRQVAAAHHLPWREALESIAKSLRELVAQYDLPQRAQADGVIAQCENILYSTSQDEGHRLPALMQQALDLIDGVMEAA